MEWLPISIPPTENWRCLVHAKNRYYTVAVFNTEINQFIDKDGQPVAAAIEWAYIEDRPE